MLWYTWFWWLLLYICLITLLLRYRLLWIMLHLIISKRLLLCWFKVLKAKLNLFLWLSWNCRINILLLRVLRYWLFVLWITLWLLLNILHLNGILLWFLNLFNILLLYYCILQLLDFLFRWIDCCIRLWLYHSLHLYIWVIKLIRNNHLFNVL